MADLPAAVAALCSGAEFTLDETQARAVHRVVVESASTWVKGRAGSGKSRMLSALKAAAALRQQMTGRPFRVALCATTNNAALIVGNEATTLHRFLSLRVARDSAGEVGEAGEQALESVQVLVVDEASMLHPALFRSLHLACEKTGTILVVVGDFQQLPPVHTANVACDVEYAYETEEWKQRFPKEAVVNFTTIYRQSAHQAEFREFLASLRKGELTDKVEAFVRRRAKKNSDVPPEVLRIYGRVEDVRRYNEYRGLVRADESRTFVARDWFAPGQDKDQLAKELPGLSEVTLYTGMPVMVVANLKSGDKVVVPNGSMGTVTGFLDYEKGELDLPLAGSPEAKDMSEAVIVRLADTGRNVLVPWHKTTINDSTGAKLAETLRVPLLPAYALTAHRTQGMTLRAAAVNMCSMWGKNMVYMACSRVPDAANLHFVTDGENVAADVAYILRAVRNVREAEEDDDEGDGRRGTKRARPDAEWANPFEDD